MNLTVRATGRAAGATPRGVVRQGGFLDLLEMDMTTLQAHPHALGSVRSGELHALIVHGAYSGAAAAAAVQTLRRGCPDFVRSDFPPAFRSHFFGLNLNLCDAADDAYFAEAARFNALLDAWPTGSIALPRRIGTLLSALDGGRPVTAAPGRRPGEACFFTTLRRHEPGGYIPAHFDNEMRLRPAYAHLRDLVDEQVLSFVLTLDPGLAGGELEIFDLVCEAGQARLLNDDRVVDKPDLSSLRSVRLRLPAGSLVVLDSGRRLHRLTRVEGPAARWTACSFMALSRDGRATCCWG